jgi:hypothetical protein
MKFKQRLPLIIAITGILITLSSAAWGSVSSRNNLRKGNVGYTNPDNLNTTGQSWNTAQSKTWQAITKQREKLPDLISDFSNQSMLQAFDSLHTKISTQYAFTDWNKLYATYRPQIEQAVWNATIFPNKPLENF